MIEVGFEIAGALNCGIHEARTIPAMSFGKCSRAAAVYGACALIGGIEGAKSPVRPEVMTIPEIHQPQHALLDALHPGGGITLERPRILEPLENSEGESLSPP